MKVMSRILWMLMVLVGLFCAGQCLLMADELADGFINPPDKARPGVYWYFMDGNQTREGMEADLRAMHAAGLRKALFLEVNIGVPRGPVNFMSEKWQDNFAYAVRVADELGMEIILGTGPGWAGAGGPWIDPPRSMQHLRTSRVDVKGPGKFTEKLPVPEPRAPSHFAGLSNELALERQKWHDDVAVLAFRTPAAPPAIDMFDVKVLNETQPYSIWKRVPRYVPTKAEYAEAAEDAVIKPDDIIDLASRLKPDGSLDWDIPEGNWTVMRFAARNNSCTTRPAPGAGHGFEVDRFSAEAFGHQFKQFHQKLLDKIGPRREGRGWTCLHLDSWESSSQNWSADFRAEFIERRGYDPQPFFPVYAGLIVDSLEKTERFLWDLRKTAAELVIENHAGAIKKRAYENGMYFSCEPYDMNPAGDIDLGAVADIPMCEFWSSGPDTVYSCIEAVSIAHTIGRSVVRAEAFTTPGGNTFRFNPADMKNQTDWAFAMGINDLIFHTFQHQPLGIDGPKPGMAMGPYGLQWHRNETFWPMVKPYHDYIARCGYLLSQGVPVADILYLAPEGAPNIFLPPDDAMQGGGLLREKKGYSFDAVSADILMAKAVAKNGRIVFRYCPPSLWGRDGGISYSVLVLPGQQTMTPELLETIEKMVRNGITVIGNPPRKSPSFVNYPECDEQVEKLVGKMWKSSVVPADVQIINYGKGRIVWGGKASSAAGMYPGYESTAALLREWGVVPAFESTGPVRYHQRRTDNRDIFFVSNREGKAVDAVCRFRTDGGRPELWNPATGVRRTLPEFEVKGGVVSVLLKFAAQESCFVVFDRKAGGKDSKGVGVNFAAEQVVADLTVSYEVSFDPAFGGPAGPVKFEELVDWTKHSEAGVKFYSGEAVYRKTFDVPAVDKDQRAFLDLGVVHKLARVKLNGEDLGIVWTSPYRVEVTGKLRETGNELEITVCNTWVNRLIGDKQAGNLNARQLKWENGLLEGKTFNTGPYTFTTSGDYNADSPLQESGLLGPVRVVVE